MLYFIIVLLFTGFTCCKLKISHQHRCLRSSFLLGKDSSASSAQT